MYDIHRRPLLFLLVVSNVVLMVALLSLQSCGARAANEERAFEIPAPVGVNCYVIRDGNGQAVGGNCLYSR